MPNEVFSTDRGDGLLDLDAEVINCNREIIGRSQDHTECNGIGLLSVQTQVTAGDLVILISRAECDISILSCCHACIGTLRSRQLRCLAVGDNPTTGVYTRPQTKVVNRK